MEILSVPGFTPPLAPEGADKPLSYGQRALWFLDRLAPGNPAYVIAGAARARGLDAAALGRAATALAERHPALRTTFHDGSEGPVQRVEAEIDVELLAEDATALDAADLARRLTAVAYRPFDLRSGPPWRLALLRLAAGEQALVLAIHHIVSDFWSLAVLLRDLGALYGAEIGMSPAGLPEPGTDFARVVAGEAARLAGAEGERLWEFWRETLSGVPLVLDLPTDRPRPPVQTYHGEMRSFALPPGLSDDLRRLTRRHGATLYMGLLAAFDVLLHRYSGQERLLVGCPTTGRKSAETAGLVGYLVNPVAIAADFRGDPGFGEFLAQVRATALAAFAHQDYPLPLLAERLQQERASGRSPIFQVMCVLQKGRRASERELAALSVGEAGVRLEFGPLALESLALRGPGAQFDLSLALAETESGLGGRLGYNRDLFEPATAARILGHFEVLLTAMMGGALAVPVSRLPLLSAAEAQQMLVEWNAADPEYPGEGLVPERIAARAARAPGTIALVLEEAWLSYGELDLRAARIGRHLAARGGGPESRVAVLAERSFEMVAALLGIWKAGGAYLPLDSALPPERLAFLLADAGVAAVVVERRLAALLPEAVGETALRLDSMWDDEPTADGAVDGRVRPTLLPDHPAYVLYTSGSTGTPKGVVVAHRALDNRLRFVQAMDLAPGDSFLHKTTFSFDASVSEIFGPLLVGGKTVLARPGGERDPGYLVDLLRQHEIAFASFNMAVLAILLKEHSLRDCTLLRTMVTGGEAVPPDLPARFHAQSEAALLNRYGPTEATISVTSWRCLREPVGRAIPIGRPIARAEIYLLDRHFQPVPIGVPGELCIGGVCLARGYLERPALTAEKFIPFPFPTQLGARLYRSGDLARYRPDGAIEFVGRIDHQVKVRGFRVELGEIEAVLKEHPGLAAVAVVDREEPGTGSRRLVAYFVARPAQAVTAADLQRLLLGKLPGYMVPAAFVALDHLPIGSSGKVDRRALPEPEAGESSQPRAESEAPRGPLEELLAGIWADLLGARSPDRQDNFFELGGHSLLATQVTSRVRQALGVELPLQAIFEAPTLAGFAAAVEAARGEGGIPLAPPPIGAWSAGGAVAPPLSFAQERLWFLDRLRPGSSTYNMPAALRLSGRLDVSGLENAWAALLVRHEALRTTFALTEGGLIQRIAPPSGSTARLPRIDLGGLPDALAEATLHRLAAEEAAKPFDLERGPLARLLLVRLGAADHATLFNLHHSIADGWSIGILIRELTALYGGEVAGRPVRLPELNVRYADFAAWQRGWLSGEVLAAELAYWRERLAGAPALLELPADRPRPALQSFRGGALPGTVAAGLLGALQALGRREGATLFMVLLAALDVLLFRLTGQEDLVVGTPIAGRTRLATEGLVGLFLNTLALRAQLGGLPEGGPDFRSLLAQVRAGTLADFAHQDLPFEKVVSELTAERDLSHAPLYQVLLVLQNAPAAALELPGLVLRPVEVETETAKLDLELHAAEAPAGLALHWLYSRDLFDAPTVARFHGYFLALLEAVVASTIEAKRWGELPLLSRAERHQLLREWNDSPISLTWGNQTLGERLAARAALSPGEPAVIGGGLELTYGELQARAARLSWQLRRLGVGPGLRVGIYLERSPELVVGLLATVGAGGAYVVLDPAYPAERLAFLVRDSGVAVLLTRSDLASRLGDSEPSGPPILLLDGSRPSWGEPATLSLTPPAPLSRPAPPSPGRGGRKTGERSFRFLSASLPSPGGREGGPGEGPGVRAEPREDFDGSLAPEGGGLDDLLYIIYTSGSTGLPKGAGVYQRGFVNLLRWYVEEFDLSSADRFLVVTSAGFDLTQKNFFAPLLVGGLLVLADPGAYDPREIVATIERHRITRLNCTPSAFYPLLTLLETGGWERLASLRSVFLGGEPIAPAQLAAWRRAIGRHTEVVNTYGPTECTDVVAFHRLPPAEDAGSAPVPLGRPVLGVRLLVLDPQLSPSPLGVAGQLAVGGVGVGVGYLGRPELTAEKFVPDPFADTPGARLYWTGDLARTLPSGELDFLGRVDDQVKIRGFRIELGEIESALAACPGVGLAAVLARSDRPGERRLVAYVSPHEAGRVPAGLGAELRAALAARLPEYMVPSRFVILPKLPLSANGKVDRKALPAPENPEESTETPALRVAPRTEPERFLAGLFGQTLGIAEVGVTESFFELGGDSISGAILINRVQEALGKSVPVVAIFDHPTVAGLAAHLEGGLRQAGPGVGPRRQTAERSPVALSFAQERLWFLEQLDPGSTAYHIAGAFRLRGDLDPRALYASFGEIVRRHGALRTTFHTGGGTGQPVQVVEDAVEPRFPLMDLGGLPAGTREDEGRRIARGEAVRPFDLGRGPLLRVGLVRLAEREHLVLVAMHHIVSDGWSMGVLVGELGVLYRAFGAGAASPLPPLSIQYTDFAVWQRGWLSGETLEAETAYWREALAGLPPLDLPTDRPRPARRRGRGALLPFRLPADLSASLARQARAAGATLFMTLAAGLAALLSRFSGQEDVAFGTPIAHRTHREIEGLIGFFVNTLVLRSDLSGAPTFSALLARVRRRTLTAFAHQDLPFEKVVEILAPERDPSRTALFQILFALQNAPARSPELPGLTLEPFPLGGETAKFDLTLNLSESADTAGTGSLAGVWEYDRDLFDGTTVERLGGHLERLLTAAMSPPLDPGLPVADLPLLSAAQRAQLTDEWNDTAAEGGELVHELVAAQARRRPLATAVTVSGEGGKPGERLTYGDLATRAGRLARRLCGLGVGPEVPVAVCIGASPWRVVAGLAVLEAGGAYIPLDPGYPQERLAYVFADARPPVVLTESGLAGRLPISSSLVLQVDLQDDEVEAPAPISPAPLPAVDPDNLAYVIYTSGSTGRPKGVELHHRGLANLVRWHRERYSVGSEDRATLVASPGFDAAVWELWPYLASGASVHLVGEEERLSAEAIVRLWAAERVTIAFLPTPLAEAVVEAMERMEAMEAPGGGVPPVPTAPPLVLRALVTGGDRLHRGSSAGSPFRLVNHYGPSEYSVVTTVADTVAGSRSAPPIGRPIANTRVVLVGPRGEAVPAGAAGELCISGAGMARGYLGRPDLTAERFTPDPLAAVSRGTGEPGARFYRTGDRARFLADGQLEFLGRLDRQVKIRGFRIEPGEVEAVLRELGVEQAAVVVREDRPGDRRLVAYVVGGEGLDLGARSRERLPGFMVPSAFLRLSRLPLTPHGKLDERALPRPESGVGEEPVGLETPAEEIVAGIWAQVLQVERVGALDDFFALGGHSLLATQVAARLRQAFGVEVPLRALFESPTVRALAAVVEGGEGVARGRDTGAPPLRPRPPGEAPPLSFAQERLWFLDQLAPGSASYNLPVALRLEGALDRPALVASLEEIVRRHEALRTSFRAAPGGPVQVIAPAVGPDVPQVCLAGLPAQFREAEARRLAGAEAARPFDLATGPLLRASLLRLAPRSHLLILNLHHSIADGWSMGILVREMGAFYGALVAGRPSPLVDLAIQYADYAVWQRDWLSGEVLARQLAWWRERLTGMPEVLDLPGDRPRPAVSSLRGGSLPVVLPAGLAAAVAGFGGRHGATSFMVLLTAFSALLSRFSSEERVVVGSPVANRTHREVEELIGFFVNTLPLPVDLTGDPALASLLGEVRSTALAAYGHQDVPFEKLVEELAPRRSLAWSPLFQVVLVLQNAPLPALALPGLTAEPLGLDSRTEKFDLTLALAARDGELAGALSYSTDLFERTTVERLSAGFEVLLAGMLAEPARRVSELPLLSAAQRAQLLGEWNDTAAEGGELVHELFAAQARLRPLATAVTGSGACGSLTYGELAARAGRLAHQLRGLGVGPEVPVAVCIGASPWRVVAVLAVLQAGGAYIPLDPGYPPERLAYVFADARPAVVLTERSLAGRLPGAFPVVLYVDDEVAAPDRAQLPAPLPAVDADNLAYVIYTSGSTGRPKGVELRHGGLANLVRWHRERYSVGPEDRATLVASPGFDAAVWELWPYLTSGASVHLVGGEERLSAAAMVRLWAAERVTLAFLPTPLAEAVVERLEETGGGVPTVPSLVLRALLTGGDRLHRGPASGSPFRLVNHYGPSEYSVVTTVADIAEAAAGSRSAPPIGRPIANTRVVLVGPRGEVVPPGAAGELCISGAGMARGYLGRPDLTAERFTPDPLAAGSGEPGARFYRTGDRARFLADGQLEFLGRLDRQVKIRGFRIEPGEVEAVLRELPGVEQVAVIVREDRPGDRRLVAYVVGGEGLDLRARSRERLPEFMVPAAFLHLPTLPLTPHGKLDERALPRPEGSAGEEETARPETPAEEVMAGLWAEVLGIEAVQGIGRDSSFFELGGHSLLATRLLSRVAQAFGVELPLRTVFEEPTLRGLAAAAEASLAALATGSGPLAPPLRPVPREGVELPLSFAQERLWFLDRLQPGSAAYNVPAALRLSGRLDVSALERAWTALLCRHEALRTTFGLVDGRPIQEIAPPPRSSGGALPLVDLGGLPVALGERVLHRLAVEEAGRPFDLSRGPLARLLLVRLGPAEHVALFNLHHAITDGWSIGILVRELTALYAGAVDLPELAVQYADFSIWQRGWLSGEVLAAQLGYWRERLAGAPALLALPIDRPRPTLQSFRGGSRLGRLAVSILGDLQAFGRREGATLFMVLLAAFDVLLSRLTGQEDLVVGTPVAGRTRLETEGLIGLFVNTLALRTEMSGARDPSFRSLLGRVRTGTLAAYAHQDLPFEKVVSELAVERDLSHAPLFQVLLVLQNTPAAALELPGLVLRPVEIETEAAKLDLTLTASEDAAGLALHWLYSRDLFDAPTVARFQGYLLGMLEGVIAEPERGWGELPLLSRAERHQLLLEWNGETVAREEPREELPLYPRFATQAARSAGEPAVLGGGDVLTYGQLQARVVRLARQLRQLGVGPGRRVGICLERSPELVVGLLATVCAGGAYVVFDPSYPAERLAFLIADSEVAVVLSRSDLAARLAAGGPPVLCLDGEEDPDVTAGALDLDAMGAGGLDDLLYVIYTSGSTGQPKGAGVYQRGFVNLLRWYVEEFGLSSADRFLVLTSAGFDLTQKNLFAPLLVGGRLVLADPGAYDPREIVATIERHRITRLNCTPSAFYPLLEAGGLERLSSLRSVFLGGEPIAPAQLASWRRSVGRHTEVVNTYGPTECTDVVAFHRLPLPEDAGSAPVPVGRPLPGVRLLVLDPQLVPLPLGVAGQLAVGGVGVGAGYLGRPDLTAEKFVPDPFAAEPGSRLYWTGDLARTLPAGDLDFLGRVDDQVKVRGFRIELGEIESALAACPGVSAAAVLARAARPVGADRPGERRLVAYVSPREGDLSASELRAALSARLPDYMVPSQFVILPELPLSANGKVDRKALPAPEESLGRSVGQVAPRTESERFLAGLFGQALGASEVGVTESFFDLGGNSISGAILINRLQEALGKLVPVVAIFDHPTVAGLAAYLEGIPGEASSLALAPLGPRRRAPGDTSPIPLSFAQERLWFLDRLQPGNSAYNVPAALRLSGRLDVPSLESAWAALLSRHEVLRTTFGLADGQPVQVIAPLGATPLPWIDLGGLPAALGERALERLAAEEARRPFDLSRGPLARLLLVRLGPAEHAALFDLHHAITDGWSIGILVRELTALYAGAVDLPELAVQYADFSIWQRGWLTGEVLAAQLGYWRERLAKAPALLALPADRPRPSLLSFRGGSHAGRLPAGLLGDLEALGRGEGATLFMVLLAVFSALLSRLTGQEDLVVGTPVAGRTRVETEGLIGLFVNTLALRVQVGGAASFRALLGRVRTGTLEAFAHQDLPFEKVVGELAVERDLSHAPLFQVLLVLQNAPVEAVELPGLVLRPVEVVTETAKLDLTLNASEDAAGLALHWLYSRDLFDAPTVARFDGHLMALLEGVIAEPEEGFAELPLLSSAERHQLLLEWNEEPSAREEDLPLFPRLSARAARSTGEPAVLGGGGALTYGELQARVLRLAWQLRQLGVGSGRRVGICLERSPELVVGLLATVCAGGAYVVLDPSYPAERLAFLLADSQVAVILSRSDLAGRFAASAAGGPPVLFLNESESDLAGDVPDLDPQAAGGLDDLLYVIYTSGSTGQPKGAGVYQRGFVNLLRWYIEEFGISAADRFLVLTSAGFDLTQKNFFAPLLVGGLLVLADPGAYDPREIVATIERHRITRLNCTPSAFYPLLTLLETGGLERLSSLRSVFLGGEPIAPAQLASWRRSIGRHTEVVNTYGPTECTDVVAFHRLALPEVQPVPVGRPVPGVRLLILDAQLFPLPLGVAGQLAVGGVGVGAGYLGRPDLTAEKFVPDPFAKEPGARLYWTGDLARLLPAGEIDFLGRVDDQVKVRGFRIELGEIEAALAACPGVSATAVLARPARLAGEDRPGERRLVAYVSFRETEPALVPAELRAALSARLPEYMVPSLFVILPVLPLSANGKVDRKVLPAPETGMESPAERVAPRTESERFLAGLFCQALGVAEVGVTESFFDLGGNSISGAILINRVQEALGELVPVAAIFDHPTVAGLATYLEGTRGEASSLITAPLGPRRRVPDDTSPIPLSFAQERLWFLDRLQPGSSAYNVPAALRLSGRLDIPSLESAWAALLSRHETLRTTFGLDDDRPVQVIAPPSSLPLPLIDLGGLPTALGESALHRLSAEEAGRSFDLSRGPLARLLLVRLAPTEHAALFDFHHAITDGWSIGILVRELAALYGGWVARRPALLPELPIQYADFSAWQRGWLTGEVLAAQLGYWRERLAGAPALLALPTDRPRPALQSFRGGSHPGRLPAGLLGDLEALGRREGATLFMVLLAGFSALLSRLTGEDDLVVGTPLSGRTRLATEGLIGLFVNTLALRTQIGGLGGLRSLLGRVRADTLAAFAHQDLPFEKIVSELDIERDLSHAPLFQVLLVLQNAPLEAVELPGLVLRPVEVETETAKLDLTLNASEDASGLALHWLYSRDLFDAPTVARFDGYLLALLESGVSDPERGWGELPLLSRAERHQLLREWNGAPVSPDSPGWDRPLDQLLAARAAMLDAKPAGEPAVLAGDEVLTYGELRARVVRLARRLRQLGIGPGLRVGVCLDRSPELVVGLLATVGAGGAYVVLDPTYPAERLAFLIADSGVSVVLSRSALAERFAASAAGGPPVLLLDGGDAPDVMDLSPAGAGGLDDLLYVIYTSGSTGQPKGAGVYQRGFVNLLRFYIEEFDLSSADRFLVVTSAGFDLTQKNFFAPLLVGGLLVLAAPGAYDPWEIVATIERHRITRLNCTPSAFYPLLEAGGPERLASLRSVFLGGEPIAPAQLAAWRRSVGRHTEVVNTYGPTECTDVVAFHRLALPEKLPETAGSAPVPVGRPLPGVRLQVLDRELAPSPLGVAGQLAVGGVGVGAGYLGRPGLTAEKFVPDPFAVEPGSRLYWTGDLARTLPTGEIDFLGRIDHQVKVRGFRIELGEIELVLRAAPGVREAVVLARQDTPGDLRLVAYVVGLEGEGFATTLSRHLADRLPEYMVPAAFVPLPALPLTPNGKLDRKALPAPEYKTETANLAPRNAIEEVLAGIFAEVLGLARVGIQDGFFRLGGHSLLATQLVSRVQGTFRVKLPLRRLFESPTVEALAAAVVETEEKAGQSEKIARALLRLRERASSITSAP